jgi:hypothetical protein
MPRYLVIYTTDSLDEPMGSLIVESDDDEAAIQAAQERLGDADNLWVLDADEVAAWHAALTDAAIEPDLRV